MVNKSNYKTKQMQYLIDFLEHKESSHFTVNDIYLHLKEHNVNIGVTTIYRHLDKLIKSGDVIKYIIDKNHPACFEYVKPHSNHKDHHYHCKCKICGDILHIKSSIFEELKQYLQNEHKFALDLTQTTLIGICEKCQTKS